MLWPRTAQIRLAMTIKLHGMPPLPRYIATLQLQTSSNCSCVHVNVRNAVYLHKNCNSSARRRQQVPVKFQLHILTFRYHRSLHHAQSLSSISSRLQLHPRLRWCRSYIHIFDCRRVHPRICFSNLFIVNFI